MALPEVLTWFWMALLEVAEGFEMLRADAEEKVEAAAESFTVGYFRELLT